VDHLKAVTGELHPQGTTTQTRPEDDPIERVRLAAERFQAAAGVGGPKPPTEAPPPKREEDPVERVRDAVERLQAAVATPRAAGGLTQAMASGAALTAEGLQRLPSPTRVKELSESPEKAVVAGAATAVSALVPKAAPVAGAVAGKVEKQIERAQEPERSR
jgi:hypothetical protein